MGSFSSLVHVSTRGCWEWRGPRKPSGECVFITAAGNRARAARYAFEMEYGRSPRRLRRVCGNHLCVRPGTGHWEETATPKPTVEIKPRSVDEMTPAEVAEFKVRFFRLGSKPSSLQRRFNLSAIGLQRAIARYTRMA